MPYKLTTSRSRPAVVAGSFYPGSAENLSRAVSGLLASARSSERASLSGIIVPHAGYVYSGSVAARAFASMPVVKNRFQRCVIVGPSHFVPFIGIAAPSHAAFATPLGEMPVDTDAVKALVTAARVVIDDAPHERDHAIEVELPFLQRSSATCRSFHCSLASRPPVPLPQLSPRFGQILRFWSSALTSRTMRTGRQPAAMTGALLRRSRPLTRVRSDRPMPAGILPSAAP
jgi:hypothetical protein